MIIDLFYIYIPKYIIVQQCGFNFVGKIASFPDLSHTSERNEQVVTLTLDLVGKVWEYALQIPLDKYYGG